MSRLHAVLQRWIEVALLSVCGATVIAVISPWLIPLAKEKIFAFGLGGPVGLLVIVAFLSFAWRRPLAWLGLRHLPTYPPTWVAALVGFVLLTTFWSLHPQAFAMVSGTDADRFLLRYDIYPGYVIAWWHTVFAIIALSTAGWGLTTAWSHARHSRIDLNPPNRSAGTKSGPIQVTRLASDFAALKDWLRSDEEIKNPASDAFGHAHVARRIARRLTDAASAGDAGPTVALVGELGSGKSSIRELVVRRLREEGLLERTIIIVQISLWPFDTPEAAVRGILNKLTEGLSRHVNTASLTAVPKHYAKAIESSGGWGSSLGQLLGHEAAPEDLLKRFEEIAVSINMKIVLWIEDLERFAATEHLPEGDISHRENERLAPIRSLLYLLDRKTCITVVLAANTLGPRFDMDKLARFIEHPPRLDPQSAGKIIDFFREECLEMLGERIDPAGQARPKDLNSFTPEQLAAIFRMDGRPTVLSSIAYLCRTPRRLKQALRATLDVWTQLVGEIDFDDVLLMSVLKVTEPDVFALVEEHIDELRDGPPKPLGPSDNQKGSDFSEHLTPLMKDGHRWRHEAVVAILDFVFPHRNSEKDGRQLPDRPQGLAVHLHTDYWSRFLSVPVLSEDERDQPVLVRIEQWEQAGEGPLPNLVSDAERSDAVETFSRGLSPAALNQLLDAVIQDRSTETAIEWPSSDFEEHSPPGILAVWGIMRRNSIDHEGLVALLRKSLKNVARRNLALVDELLHYFAARDSSMANLLSDAAINDLRQSKEIALATLSETEIIDGLRGATPSVLIRCCWGLDRLRQENLDGHPFEGWETFADRLLTAMATEPAVMLPQVLPFIVSYTGSMRSKKPVFDEEKARRLFDFERLLELLREHIPPFLAANPEETGIFRAVSDAIKVARPSPTKQSPAVLEELAGDDE